MTHDCRQNPPNFANGSLLKRKQEKALERTGCERQLNILRCSTKYTNLNKYNQVNVRGVFYSASLKRDNGLTWVNSNVYGFSLVPRVYFALSFDPPKGPAVGDVTGKHVFVRLLTTEVVCLLWM